MRSLIRDSYIAWRRVYAQVWQVLVVPTHEGMARLSCASDSCAFKRLQYYVNALLTYLMTYLLTYLLNTCWGVEIKPNQMRLGEHCDYGTMTLLFQLDSEGLQVGFSV